MDTLFNSSFGLKLTPEAVAEELVRFMQADKKRSYKIVIGSDSERVNDKMADFVVAVVVHRVGNGGRYFWRRTEINRFWTLHDRIIQEVMISLDTAKEILGKLKDLAVPHFDFEIHADIGEKGDTKSMIQEVVGMIRANNFEPKTKPDSYAATKVADRHT